MRIRHNEKLFKRDVKTYNNLFYKICSYDNFFQAYENATKGKKWYKEVLEIEKDRNNYIKNLADEVRENRYTVSEYTIFQLWSGGKWRTIYKLPMKDRIVQHAIMTYCEPIFRETFIQDTFSSIKGRGIHRGMTRVKRAIRSGAYKYVLQLDIHQCYPSIDHSVLKKKLFKKFIDPKLQHLFTIIIDSCEKGLPIGNYTSQYFNNFYFNDLDHWLKEQKRIKYYFRYCDDIVIFGKNKKLLHQLLQEIKHYLYALKVQLKSNYRIFPIKNGVNFLGYITYETHIRVRKQTKLNFIRKIRNIDLSTPNERDINVLGSYWGILKHGDCRNLWFKYTKRKTLRELDLKNKRVSKLNKNNGRL